MALLLCTTLVHSKAPRPDAQALTDHAQQHILFDELPPEGRQTYRLIHRGGPFPYEKDGTVFGNRERLLPRQPRGHYREYTVRTPGANNRGARRIVCGGLPPTQPQACFYTADHYASFREIVKPQDQAWTPGHLK